ncbi:hypothetical protein HIM_08491 [Hirsutella minnesotensis 3608]|uniref:Integral membrane protein n=1 Tax=Hirsutella minnesotensis 3608 TaxID=1043627 RepID=A0A0F7ZSX4_9HYPO|nr:hypothetical protein HIM_08491 [Hirsutella minnesotensis 3608]
MAQAPITTIPPFNDVGKLPDCAKQCGPLYDANGACVPPAAPQAEPSAWIGCFCADARVAAFSKGPAGVCDTACQGNQAGLQSIAKWFQGVCSATPNKAGGNNQNGAKGGGNNNDGGQDDTSITPSPASNGGGGDWLSTHWQWVIMLVILVVGIAAIWIGACVWRRRYLRKKDSQTMLSQKTPVTAAGVPGSDSTTPMTFSRDPEQHAEKRDKEKKKWNVDQRT